MTITQCSNGHYYDADKYSSCPHCSRTEDKILIPAYSGDEPYIFVSYSHADVDRVMQFLQAIQHTHRFWYDEGIPSGKDWVKAIAERIKNCSVFLLFVSKTAADSKNVLNEVNYASNYVDEIISVHIDDVKLPSDLELMLGRFQHINYKKLGFEASIEKLQKNLPASTRIEKEDTKEAVEEDEIAGDDKKEISDRAENKGNFNELYDIGGMMDQSNIGKVFMVRQRRTGGIYVAKNRVFGTVNKAIIRAIARNELTNLLKLQGKPYAPEVVDYFETEDESYLIISKIHGFNILDNIINSSYKIKYEDAVSLIYETALVLRDIHQMELVYCDLKPSNLVLDQYGRINLVDFDNTCSVHEQNNIRRATRKYAAPEQLSMQYNTPDVRFDVYSLGILFKELLVLSERKNLPEDTIMQGLLEKHQHLKDILRKMTMEQPRNRYSSMGEVVSVLSLIIDWNPEENLRELAFSLMQYNEDGLQMRLDEEDILYPVPKPQPPIIAPPSNDGNETTILTYSVDYRY